jgi:SAM-dependent methyltransferase
MTQPTSEKIRRRVRASYAAVAEAGGGCCGPSASPCCDPSPATTESRKMGYSAAELAAVPEGSDMGLGCGNPTAIASLGSGETVLDLGSGGGFDCFLAADKVGPGGRVIGVDMTPEMVAKARENARKAGAANVEFRLGEIEHLPVADATADVVISNCVINLSVEKDAVYRDAFRALKPGGRLCVSDVVATAPMPETVARDVELVAGCIGGAAGAEEITRWLAEAGFEDIRVTIDDDSRAFIADWAPGRGIEAYVASATIEATKPGA